LQAGTWITIFVYFPSVQKKWFPSNVS